MTTFGEINYEDSYAGKKGAGKDIWLKLEEGENDLRLLTLPFQYMVHKVKKDPANKKDFGQKVPCSAMHGECNACAHGEATARWLYGVISRKTGKYQILDLSWGAFSGIKKLAKGRWGDPTKYDIVIVVDKKGGPTGYYTVQALDKAPLSASDQKIKDNDLDLDDLKRRSTPPEPSYINKRLESIFGSLEAAATVAATIPATPKKGAAKTAPKAVSMTDDEETSGDFPDYDGGQA